MNFLKRSVFYQFLVLVLSSASLFSQATDPYQKGYSAEQNLKAIGRVNPYSPGGMGFDNRYQGVVGSPLLFDQLLPSLVKVNTEEKYLNIESNLDVFQNRLIFSHPATKNLMYIPAQIIDEVIIDIKGENLIFRTTKDKKFDPGIDNIRFYQVLYSNGSALVKLAVKKLIPADYQAVYSADRRYDEFDTKFLYYYLGPDVVFHKITPTKKSLVMVFPAKRDIIEKTLREKEFENNDEMVIEVIKRISASDSNK